ncbi:hypothetical protein CL622_03170 [archaeon]|nr:hypothetical protein [archaeon]
MQLKEAAPTLIRISMSLVILWFGINQLLFPQTWLGFLPQWISILPIEPTTIIITNAISEIVLGLLLLLGFLTRFVALILSIHILGIAISVGYNDIGIRDAGLALATFSIFLQKPDKWTIDYKRQKE